MGIAFFLSQLWYHGCMVKDEDGDTVVAFTVRLPYETHKQLRRICLEHDISVNGTITALIEEYLEETHRDCPLCH